MANDIKDSEEYNFHIQNMEMYASGAEEKDISLFQFLDKNVGLETDLANELISNWTPPERQTSPIKPSPGTAQTLGQGGQKKSPRIIVGFWRRFFADFLDTILLGIPGFGIGYLFRYTFSAMGLHAIWFGLVFSFLYYGLQHTRLAGGQTLGKRLLGIQVLRRDGEYLDFGKSFLRYLVVSFVFYNGIYQSLLNYLPPAATPAVGSVYFLIVIWAFFACFLMIPLHPLKRGLHDIVAGSVVVYKGKFDYEALDCLEDPAKTKRAVIILTIVSVILAGGCLMGISKFTSGRSDDIAKMTEIRSLLETDYDVIGVSINSYNGKPRSLSVSIYVPLATFENKAEKERIRKEVFNKVGQNFNNLDRFGGFEVVFVSGFNIGIAHLNIFG